MNIIMGDALENIPTDGTIFYLFNPFDERVMVQFRDKMEALFLGKKEIVIIYYRPLHLNVFSNPLTWKVEKFEIPLEALDSSYSNSPSHRQYAVIQFRYQFFND